MPREYKRILVVNTFGIGDVLFTTPMLKTLKTYYPDANIDFMCNKRGQYIVQHNKSIKDIILFEKDDFRKSFQRSKIEFMKKLYRFLRGIKRKKYDLAIDLSLGYQISLLLKLLWVKKRIGFAYRKRGKFLTDKLKISGFSNKHVVEYYLDILKLIGIPNNIAEKNFELALSTQDERWAGDFIRQNKLENKLLIGIAPGGGKSWGKYAIYRRWDAENFCYVAQKMSNEIEDIFFLIFGSKDEEDISQIVKETLARKVLNLCGELPLSKSMALIKRCKLILCNDGGILHIAVSQGVNTVSIFGPVDHEVYGPYPPSDKHKVITAEDVKCRPCYKNFKHRGCQTHDCLNKVSKDKVLKIVTECLNAEMRIDGGRR